MTKNMLSIKGQRFGELTAIEPAGRTRRLLVLWKCECSCGNTVVRTASYLKAKAKSCGCVNTARLKNQGTHNNARRGATSPTWSSWKAMVDRCKENHKSKKYYFDRGITVCTEWEKDFARFLSDMGDRPSGTTLDRIDSDKGYTKQNCRWATPSQQQSNKTTTTKYDVNSVKKTLTDWARDPICVVTYGALYRRVKYYGMDILSALTTKQKGS